VGLIYQVGRNSTVVYPSKGETFVYMDRFFWFVRWGAIKVIVGPYGINVRENGVLVEVHADET